MLAVMTMIMPMILTMVMILMKRRVLFHKPAPRRASRWGWKDPLCPAQNRSQSPEKDQLCHHHDSEDSPEVSFWGHFLNLWIRRPSVFSIFSISPGIPLIPDNKQIKHKSNIYGTSSYL